MAVIPRRYNLHLKHQRRQHLAWLKKRMQTRMEEQRISKISPTCSIGLRLQSGLFLIYLVNTEILNNSKNINKILAKLFFGHMRYVKKWRRKKRSLILSYIRTQFNNNIPLPVPTLDINCCSWIAKEVA